MALAAVAFAKAKNRRQMMACTTSIGPGATNMVTAAGVAHVNRLPVLFLPGDVFASRRPDPVLQQIEDFNDATISVNDCFRPVSRWWDRITRPEQLLTSLPRAIQVLTDPGRLRPGHPGHVPGRPGRGLRLPGELLRARQTHRIDAPAPTPTNSPAPSTCCAKARAAADRRGRRRALFSRPHRRFRTSPRSTRIPVAETQAGKSCHAWDHPQAAGSIGVTGSSRRQHAGARGRRDPGGRHPAAGFHHRLPRAAAGRRPR